MKIAACYIRVSTDDQLEYSPDSQLEAIRQYAKQNDYILPEEFVFIEHDGISGSMSNPVSAKSDVRCYEIGLLLGLIANKICDNSIFYVFNNQIGKYPVTSFTPILETVTRSNCGGGTNMYLPFDAMLQENIKADRVIIISDNECNCRFSLCDTVQSIADRYRKKANPDLWVHAIDLQGYGTQQFHGTKTNIIAGWSEKVFDFIKLAEQGEGTLEKAIAEYTF